MTKETLSFLQAKINTIENFVDRGSDTRVNLQSRIELLQRLPDIAQERYENLAPQLYRDIEANANAQDKRDRQINYAYVLMERKQARLNRELSMLEDAESFISKFQALDGEYEELTALYRSKKTDRFALQPRVDKFWQKHDATFADFAEKVKEWVVANPRIVDRMVNSGILTPEEAESIIAENYNAQVVYEVEMHQNEQVGEIHTAEVKTPKTKVKKPLYELLASSSRDSALTLEELVDAIYGPSSSEAERNARKTSLYQVMYNMSSSLPPGFRIANAEALGRGKKGRYYLEQLITQEELEIELHSGAQEGVQVDAVEEVKYQADIENSNADLTSKQMDLETPLVADLTVKDFMFVAIRLQQTTRVNWYNKVLGADYTEKVLQAGLLKNLENLLPYDGGFTPVVKNNQEHDLFMRQNAIRILRSVRDIVSSKEYEDYFYDLTQSKDVNQFMLEMYNIHNQTIECFGERFDGIEFLIQSFERPSEVERDLALFKLLNEPKKDNSGGYGKTSIDIGFAEELPHPVEENEEIVGYALNGIILPENYYQATEALGDEDLDYKAQKVSDVEKYLKFIETFKVEHVIEAQKLIQIVAQSGLPELTIEDINHLRSNKTIQFIDEQGEHIMLDLPTAAIVMYWKQRGNFGTKAVKALHEWVRNYYGI